MEFMVCLSKLLDIIYPPRCHICGRFLSPHQDRQTPEHLCGDCLAGLSPVTHPMCTVCGLPFPPTDGEDHLCENCLHKAPWYDLVRAPYLYVGLLMEAIQRFKYKAETHLISSFGPLLSSFARDWMPNPHEYLAIPVPLHRYRLRARGFNQSLLLARVVSSDLGTRLDYLSLVKKRHTMAQTGLGKEERRKNVKGAFSVSNPEVVEGEKILLIDDVFTTGHTLNECARTLKRAGANAVVCLALARVRPD